MAWISNIGRAIDKGLNLKSNTDESPEGASMGDFRRQEEVKNVEVNSSNLTEQLPVTANMADFRQDEETRQNGNDHANVLRHNEPDSISFETQKNLENTMENWWKPKVTQADFLSDQVLFSQYSSGHGASIFEKYGKEGLYLWGASGGTLSPEKPDEWDSDLMRSVARNLEEEKKKIVYLDFWLITMLLFLRNF